MFLLAEGGEAEPLIVQFINHYFGEPVHHFQVTVTEPLWNKYVFSHLGTTAEKAFGAYTVENAIPWYTIMFTIACLLTIAIVWLLKGKLSEDDPHHGQLTLEAGFLAIRGMVVSIIGEQGFKYFPVVATFGTLILVSNLMGQFPLFKSPTASVNVTFALGISSFIYYNFVGIRENGFFKHMGHLAGPKLPLAMAIVITPLIFVIELISNLIRPFTLGVRLFANMFSDEQVFTQITNLAPPYTHYVLPLVLTLLGVFVAFVQAFVFTLLSMIYLSEVSHPHHEDEDEHAHEAHGEAVVAHA